MDGLLVRFLLRLVFLRSAATSGLIRAVEGGDQLVECEQSILGELSPDKGIRSGIYDLVYGQWLIKSERADEIIRCLVEKHGWAGLRARRMGVVALARRTRP